MFALLDGTNCSQVGEPMGRSQFATWLAQQLAQKNLSQAELARRVKTSTGSVSMWINGQRVPDPSSIDKIADVLFVDVDEVLAIAGHRPRLPMDQLQKLHRLVDPYAKLLDWDDPEVQLALESALQQQVRVKEMREGKRTAETFWDPVEVDDDEEE